MFESATALSTIGGGYLIDVLVLMLKDIKHSLWLSEWGGYQVSNLEASHPRPSTRCKYKRGERLLLSTGKNTTTDAEVNIASNEFLLKPLLGLYYFNLVRHNTLLRETKICYYNPFSFFYLLYLFHSEKSSSTKQRLLFYFLYIFAIV